MDDKPHRTYIISRSVGNGTVGDALFNVRERGYIDEYNISFGGNVENIVNWGISFGITDLDYTRLTYYSESMENALIPNATAEQPRGNAGFDMSNYKHISGSGWNIKAGVIVKPINEFRIGFAVHTPTWYRLDQSYEGKRRLFLSQSGSCRGPQQSSFRKREYRKRFPSLASQLAVEADVWRGSRNRLASHCQHRL